MRELWAVASPPEDWDELLSREVGENGYIDHDCNNSEIDSVIATTIFESNLKKYKVPKAQHGILHWNVWLGHSPKFKRNEKEE